MKIFSEFSATETFLLLGRSHTDFKFLLRYGLLDLLLNRVLEIRIEELQPHPNDPISRFYNIVPGPKFHAYKPLPHDEVFLYPFTEFNKDQVLLRHLVRAALEKAKSQKKFIKKYVRKSPMIASKYKNNAFYSLFRINKLNHRGQEMQQLMTTELRQHEIDLPDLVKHDPRKTLEILLEIKANLFLLRNASSTIIPHIKPQFFTQIKSTFPNESIDFGEENYYWDLLTIYPKFVPELDRLITTIQRAMLEDEGLSSVFYGSQEVSLPWWLRGG